MQRRELILAALASSAAASYTPVQVQKLLFLIDREIPAYVGKHFKFEAYHYGPFDKGIYSDLEIMEAHGLVEITRNSDLRRRTYRLTAEGEASGNVLLQSIHQNAQQYIREVAKWVRANTFAGLVSAIYQRYPEMKVNSVFLN